MSLHSILVKITLRALTLSEPISATKSSSLISTSLGPKRWPNNSTRLLARRSPWVSRSTRPHGTTRLPCLTLRNLPLDESTTSLPTPESERIHSSLTSSLLIPTSTWLQVRRRSVFNQTGKKADAFFDLAGMKTLRVNLDGQIYSSALAIQTFKRQTVGPNGFQGKLIM